MAANVFYNMVRYKLNFPGLSLGGRMPSSNWIGGRVGPRAEMGIEEKKTVLPPGI